MAVGEREAKPTCSIQLGYPSRGNAVVQIQRTIHSGCYLNGQTAPGGRSYDIASGERLNFDQYCAAIHAARFLALRRGVNVVLLMPAEPEVRLPIAPERRAFLNARKELGRFEHFLLASIAGLGADGRRHSVYVHAKLMLVDDA